LELLYLLLVPLLFGFVDFQPTFCNIGLINSLDILKCNKLQDTLLFEEGTNITIDLNNVTKSVKISSLGGSSPNELYCNEGEFFESYNATTNDFDCVVGAGGEVNTASSSGLGESLVLAKSGVDLPFKGIACGGNIVCSANSTDVTISFTETGMGSVALDDLTDVIITSPVYLSTLFYNGVDWIDKIFTVNSFDVTCSGTDKVSRVAINNQTGLQTVTCSPDESGSGGVDVKSGLETVTEGSCTSISFNTSFSSTPVAVGNVINGAEYNVITINALTTSGFDLCMSKIGGGASSSYTVYWIATNAGNP